MLNPSEEIKNRLDLVDVIQGYLKLTKAGANYKARCPFHKEKTPSFIVSPEKQIWHCFGCNKGGDVFGFIMEMEGLEFREALRLLAQKAGVTLKKTDPRLAGKREILLQINEQASQFFEHQLVDRNKAALDYLLARGIKQKTLKKFRLGYAPDGWHHLKDYLTSLGFNEQNIIEAGLIIKPEQTKDKPSYDRFRSRIMFPIFNLASQVVGFSGRIFPESNSQKTAKYINSPNTIIYNKSRTLYGLTNARDALRKNKFAILVEGNVDVLMSHQAGVQNVLATCGTSLNEQHLTLLKRYTDKLKLCFDQDSAGSAATKEAIKKALVLGFTVKIISFKDAKDPADIVKKDPQAWKNLAKKGIDYLDYVLEKALKEYDSKTSAGKKEIAKEILPLVKSLANKIEQSFWVNKIAEALSIEEKYLYEALQKTRKIFSDKKEKTFFKKLQQEKSRRDLLEENLLALLIQYPKELKDKIAQLKESFFLNANTRKAFVDFRKEPSRDTIKDNSFLAFISLKISVDEIYQGLLKDEAQAEFDKLVNEIKKEDLRQIQRDLVLGIKRAEQENDKKKLRQLIEKLQKTYD